jgi:peptidoglycan/xylan/chitin deacetylase (PgdA/CDA1 family)
MDPRSDVTRRFLSAALAVHSAHQAPCSLFVVGKTLEANAEALKAAAVRSDIFDIQSHTYSHVLLKTVCQFDGRRTTVFRAGSPERIRREIRLGLQTIRHLLGVEPTGITTPYGYYRGLSDRPDLLGLLHRNGIRFVRSYARDSNDWQPVELDVQPFWYGPQGFPDMLEFPVHGWQDCLWREENGWANTTDFADYQVSLVEEAARADLTLSLAYHDWSAIREDPEMTIIRRILTRARELGVTTMSYTAYYKEKSNG